MLCLRGATLVVFARLRVDGAAYFASPLIATSGQARRSRRFGHTASRYKGSWTVLHILQDRLHHTPRRTRSGQW